MVAGAAEMAASSGALLLAVGGTNSTAYVEHDLLPARPIEEEIEPLPDQIGERSAAPASSLAPRSQTGSSPKWMRPNHRQHGRRLPAA